jgi:hypothetical protein
MRHGCIVLGIRPSRAAPMCRSLSIQKGSKPNKINNLREMTARQIQSPWARKLSHRKVHYQINPIPALCLPPSVKAPTFKAVLHLNLFKQMFSYNSINVKRGFYSPKTQMGNRVVGSLSFLHKYTHAYDFWHDIW